MIVFTIFSMSLAMATGYWQYPPGQTYDEQKLYYKTESGDDEGPVRDRIDENPLSDEFIEKINRMQSTWTVW